MAFKRKQPQSTAPYLCQLALGSNARLAVVEDAAAQSAVFLIRQKLLLSASSGRKTVLVTFELDPDRLLRGVKGPVVRSDWSTTDEFPERADPILAAVGSSPNTTVVVDSVDALHARHGQRATFTLLRTLLTSLTPGSDLFVRVRHDSPFSPTFRSSALSSTLVWLRLHPSLLASHVHSAYNLSLPTQSSSGTTYDLRVWKILSEVASSPSADPYADPSSTSWTDATDANSSATFDSAESFVASSGGRCVVEWTSRNVAEAGKVRSVAVAAMTDAKGNAARVDGSVHRGLEGLKRGADGSVEVVDVMDVLDVDRRRIDPRRPEDKPPDELTFDVSLNERQRADRDAVDLPYLPQRGSDGSGGSLTPFRLEVIVADKFGPALEAPGEIYDGSFGSKNKGGTILYLPEPGDDFDEEEDED